MGGKVVCDTQLDLLYWCFFSLHFLILKKPYYPVAINQSIYALYISNIYNMNGADIAWLKTKEWHTN